jgi:hypothetical protein
MPELLPDDCAWCGAECIDADQTETCDCPVHEGEDATYCRRSCKLAHHG